MTRRQKVWIVAVIFVAMLFATVIFVATFVLTSFIYRRAGQSPSPFLDYLINVVLGLIFVFVITSSLGRFFGSKQRADRAGVFGPILEAMQKIAKGDFSVRLDTNFRDNPLVSQLTTGVNNMALELDQMERMRQEFISNVSHELQSPLTSIRGFARALHNVHLDVEERNHYLSIIEAESLRLSRLTENLLKLASLESEHVKFDPKPYRLDKQIRNLILACEPQWTGKEIEMDVSLAEVTITADEDLMSQVWMNLIANSIKFTPDHGRICIELHRHARNGNTGNTENVEFKINDTGIGISEADQAHIFERFYKADKSRTHANNGGSGLGLAIAHKIVTMHQGKIGIDSKAGEGATFTVLLPSSGSSS